MAQRGSRRVSPLAVRLLFGREEGWGLFLRARVCTSGQGIVGWRTPCDGGEGGGGLLLAGKRGAGLGIAKVGHVCGLEEGEVRAPRGFRREGWD